MSRCSSNCWHHLRSQHLIHKSTLGQSHLLAVALKDHCWLHCQCVKICETTTKIIKNPHATQHTLGRCSRGTQLNRLACWCSRSLRARIPWCETMVKKVCNKRPGLVRKHGNHWFFWRELRPHYQPTIKFVWVALPLQQKQWWKTNGNDKDHDDHALYTCIAITCLVSTSLLHIAFDLGSSNEIMQKTYERL